MRRVRDLSCGDTRVYLELEVRRVACRGCQRVKQERLDWLAANPFYTKRFAFFVGRRCRTATISDVARETKLDWKTVKDLETQYMREQLRRFPVRRPRAIGIDEISIRKGHTYRIVVSDLDRRRPIWFGGIDRSQASMDPFYTKRFAFFVGRRCRTATISDVARETQLDWKTVKELEKQYMAEQLRRFPVRRPRAIGIDEISIRKGHTYRIVVSDLDRRRPIWFGGIDRSQASMDRFYQWLGPAKSQRIQLAVMDMWKQFRDSTQHHAPQASILFDKFHIMRHLGEALDTVRKSEYARLSGKDRRFIKGQKYTLLSHRENLSADGRRALKTLLRANKRLNTAYLLKESFGQLWDYQREGWARRFFDNWKAALKWQRLKPYEKFADLVERHWDGIAAYCRPENKVSLGFVEGFNNKIRVLQRRAYGLRDEEYLRLKILTCMLPAI